MEGWPESKRMSPEWIAKLREKYPDGSRTKIVNLATSHRYALAEYYCYDRTNRQIRDKYGFSEEKWRKIRRSDEGQQFKEFLESRKMPEIVRDLFQAESLNVSIDLKMLYDWAVEDGNYKTASKIAMDMIKLGGIETEPPKKSSGIVANQVILNLGGRDVSELLQSPTDTVEADYEVVSDET